MGRVNVVDLAPNMVLAADMLDASGQVLFERNTILERRHLRMAHLWGATEAEVLNETWAGAAERGLQMYGDGILSEAQYLLEALAPDDDFESDLGVEVKRLCLFNFAWRLNRGQQIVAASPVMDASPAHSPGAPPSLDEALKTLLDGRLPPVCGLLNAALGGPPVVSGKSRCTPSRLDSLAKSLTNLSGSELGRVVLEASQALGAGFTRVGAVTLHSFWLHSLACAVFAKLLAVQAPKLIWERSFMAGLLHDVGRLGMIMAYPEHMTRAMALAGSRGQRLVAMEQEVFGWDHAELGAQLVAAWGLPAWIGTTIRGHHDPLHADGVARVGVLAVANCMAVGLRYGSSGSSRFPAMDEDLWARLDLPLSVLATVALQGTRQLDEIMTGLGGGADGTA